MKKSSFKWLIAGVIAFILVGGFVSYHNTWNDLITTYDAHVEKNKVIYDNTWKVIKQQAQVTDKYASDFKETFMGIMEGRNYGGEAFKWVQEQNPNLDPSLYTRLMNTIESKRDEWTINQTILIDQHREMVRLKGRLPSNFFLMLKDIPDLKTITSEKTKKAMETGEENDVDVF